MAVCGTDENSTTSMIIRGNVCEDDAIIVAKPKRSAEKDLNYRAIVIENNYSKDCKVGIELGDGVEAVLKDNEFENTDEKIIGISKDTVLL